jgi:hypothetical protein
MSLLGWPSSRMGTAMTDGPMTAPLVERVARTICGHTGCLYPQQMCRTDCRGPQQAVMLEHQPTARAAIADVFDWLEERARRLQVSAVDVQRSRKEALGEEP